MSTSNNDPISNATIVVTLTDIKVRDLPDIGWPKRPGKYYVKLIVDEDIQKTTVAPRGNAAAWKESFRFDTHPHSKLECHVYAMHKFGYDDCVGGMRENMDGIRTQGPTIISRKLCRYDTNGEALHELQPMIEFTITCTASSRGAVEYQMDNAIEQVKDASVRVHPAASTHIRAGIAADYLRSVGVKSVAKAVPWESFLNKVELFTKIVDQVSEVHPYAKIAWSVLSVTHKIILAQKDRDSNIIRLVDIMDDVYAFVHEAEPLKRIRSHQRIVVLMAQQTTECAFFIRDYVKNKNFWERTLKNMLSDVDAKIKQYEDKFTELKTALQGRAIVQTGITVQRILDRVENLAAEVDLNDMPYAEGARFDREKGCLPGTREEVIDEIIDWVNSDGDHVPCVYLLSGLAGSGKSAIAHTVALRFHELERLGSSFFFDRAYSTDRRPDNLFSTISRDLADLDPQRKRSLWQVIQGRRALRTTRSAREQFDQFILNPAAKLMPIGPIVVVIDALDESGDSATRKALLAILADQAVHLPSNFRILVTSRPERDIQNALGGKRHVVCKDMDTIDMMSTKSDISLFVRAELAAVHGLERNWPNEAWRHLLAEKSEGLFQWASTACLFIKGDGQEGLDPSEQLEILLSLTPLISKTNHLDQLYLEILSRTFGAKNAIVMNRFKAVMGRMLAAREPLSVSALREMWCGYDLADAIRLIIPPLGSLLSSVGQETDPVRPLHTSFRDFLTDPERSGLFYVDVSPHHRSLVLATLRIMNTRLRFNICELKTSHVRNGDVPDLPARIARHIPAHLSYACQFWAHHLQVIALESEILEGVKQFLFQHLLYWLEVLSLINEVNSASKGLRLLLDWSRSQDDALVGYTQDAIKFVTAFGSVISQSAPHIYLSALPFSPTESSVSRQFLPQFPNTLTLESGRTTHWPAIQNILEGHTSLVLSVAFSNDGKRVVSGSQDKTIRVWATKTGGLVSGPFYGHTRGVNSVGFSHESKYIVSGSDDKTILVRNADTGKVVLGPLEGHTKCINSVAFFQDGMRIVSGSNDKTVRIWNAETGDLALRPFEGHTSWVSTVAASSNGKRVASGSADNTIRLWDAETGDVLGVLREADIVRCVALSQDGKHIASGSNDNMVRVWNAATGDAFRGPFEGHTDPVRSVALSQDGKHVVSGSLDKTIRIWDAETCDLISGPLEGHTDFVTSVAISSDGKHVVSGSNDKTIRVWDARPRAVIPESFVRHTHWINTVAVSHDGKHIVSGSHDKTIRIWDADTGEAVSGPYVGHTDNIFSISITYDCKRIASGSADGTIRVWNMETGEIVLGPLAGHTNTVRSVAFSQDGKRIVSGSYDTTIRVWDGETGDIVLAPLEGHTEAVMSVAFSQDGRNIVSGSWDKTIRAWNAKTGDMIRGPFEGHAGWVSSVVYSPDGKYIASGSGDRMIKIWDAKTGALLVGPLKGHSRAVRSVAFSKDGRHVVSGGEDNTILVWDAKTGMVILGPLEGHTGVVNSAAFSQDSKHIVSGSTDQTIRVWDAQEGSALPKQQWTGESLSGGNVIIRAGHSLGHAFGDGSKLENGWILSSPSTLLFWVPPWYRVGLWRPRTTAIIGQAPVKLDFSRFVHGTSWEQCKKA